MSPKQTHPGKKRYFWEHYKCGCTSDDVGRRDELLGYCAVHGADRWRVYASARFIIDKGKLPRTMMITFPKAGKHLLKQILQGSSLQAHPATRFCGKKAVEWWGPWRPRAEIVQRLDAVRQGSFMSTHAIYKPWLNDYFQRRDFKAVVLTRDLRDIVVSLAHFIGQHTGWHRLLNVDTVEGRMEALLKGEPPLIPPIRERWDAFMPWLDQDWIYHTTYEALRTELPNEVFRIAKYLGLPSSDVEKMWAPDTVDPKKATVFFRGGRLGDWRQEFTPELVELAKREFEGLGYEW